MSIEYGIIFLQGKCTQCHACEVACKAWRNVEPGIRLRTINNVWKGSYPDVECRASSIACVHCAEPSCADACPEQAILKRAEDGIVIVDRELCTGCRTCYDACPYGVPQFDTEDKMRKCDLCIEKINFDTEVPPCVATCPVNALAFVKMNREEKISMEKSTLEMI
jgi:anaerobic dimethyl sulfoxide reductase subunit B